MKDIVVYQINFIKENKETSTVLLRSLPLNGWMKTILRDGMALTGVGVGKKKWGSIYTLLVWLPEENLVGCHVIQNAGLVGCSLV